MSAYYGYWLTFDASRPITGRWRAVRHGVAMCAATEAALRRMIDQKAADGRVHQ